MLRCGASSLVDQNYLIFFKTINMVKGIIRIFIKDILPVRQKLGTQFKKIERLKTRAP